MKNPEQLMLDREAEEAEPREGDREMKRPREMKRKTIPRTPPRGRVEPSIFGIERYVSED